MRLIRFALTVSIVFVMGVNMAMGDSSVYQKTYTWQDSDGVTRTSKYSDKATHPAQILALLGNLYVDPEVPGFKEHKEYKNDGTASTNQGAQTTVNYDMQARMLYYFRPSPNGFDDKCYGTDQRDRVSWIAKLPGYGDYTVETYSAYSGDGYTYSSGIKANSSHTAVNSQRKKYTKTIEAPTDMGATVLFVEIKDSWNDQDLRLFTGGVGAWGAKNYSGEYWWNAFPGSESTKRNYWDGTKNVSSNYKNTKVYKKYGDNGGTSFDINKDYTDLFYSLDSAFVDKAIESVQLIHNTFRVNDPDNPGYLCMIPQVNTKRFFYIAKGRVRTGNVYPPFYVAYEQLSPVVSNTLSRDLSNGDIYDFAHDCQAVIYGNVSVTDANTAIAKWTITPHYADNDSIDEATGQRLMLNNLTLFIPDKRFMTRANSVATWKNGFTYNLSNPANERGTTPYNPKMLLYQAELTAKATPSATKGYYDIKLDWLSQFDASKIHTTVNEQFHVYAVDEQGNFIKLDEFIDANDDYESDAVVGEPTTKKTYTYRVRILDNSQKFTFVVAANPYDTETGLGSEIHVNTNTATVWVPGRDQFALDGSEYRSRYDQDNEQNLYRNTLRMRPNAAFDNIPANSEYYQMWRKTVGTEDSVLVATVTFTLLKDNPRSYSYNVDYKQPIPDGLCFDAEPARSTSGELFDNVSIDLVDYFNVSTAANEQPAEYSYALHNKSLTLSSDDFNVPVNKTKHTAYLNPLTYEQVMADTDHSVGETAKNATVNIAAIDNAGNTLQRYDLYRIEDGNTTHVGKVERQSGNTFAVSQSTDGTTWTPGTTVDLSTPQNITFTEQFDQQPDGALQYLPVITNMDPGLDATTVENTYGCDILDVYPVDFSFGAEAISQSERYAANPVDPDNHERIYRAYKAQLDLTPLLLNADADVYMYRVWREVDGVETLLNTVTPPEVTQEGDPLVDELATTYPGENAKLIYDYVIYPELQEGQTLDVNYIARLYSCIDPVATPTLPSGAPSGAPRRSNVRDEDRFYYVREMTGGVQFTNSIITGVDRVDNTPTVVRVIYYNLVGMPSAQPWPGLNVECRVISDGTTVTRKLVR